MRPLRQDLADGLGPGVPRVARGLPGQGLLARLDDLALDLALVDLDARRLEQQLAGGLVGGCPDGPRKHHEAPHAQGVLPVPAQAQSRVHG